MNPPALRFTPDDNERAFRTWGANCGPGALAAVTGMTLDEVRPHLAGFDTKRYTNPRMMLGALKSIGRPFRLVMKPPEVSVATWPMLGLVRVQWLGPWMDPGRPMVARYRHTHWIAAAQRAPGDVGVFDINHAESWIALYDWVRTLVPWLTRQHRHATVGAWHATHVVELST